MIQAPIKLPQLVNCKLCPERQHAKAPVGGSGPLTAKICIIGRNPGVAEDARGEPFVGASGQRLNEGLMLAGITRKACYVTNVVKCMTPVDVNPSRKTIQTCSQEWLLKELLALQQLRLILLLGNEALRLFQPDGLISLLNGHWWKQAMPVKLQPERTETVTQLYWVFAAYHPNMAFRNPTFSGRFNRAMQNLRLLLRKHPEILA